MIYPRLEERQSVKHNKIVKAAYLRIHLKGEQHLILSSVYIHCPRRERCFGREGFTGSFLA